jgi:hypothetical protein
VSEWVSVMKSLKIPNDDDNDDATFVLDQHTFSSNNTPMVNVLLHSGTLSWFWAKQALVLLFNAAGLAVKLQISLFLLIVSITRFTALENSTNTQYQQISSSNIRVLLLDILVLLSVLCTCWNIWHIIIDLITYYILN